MSSKKSKLKRPASPLSSSTSLSSSPDIRAGLFDCYNFLAPNEYSNKTFGLLAFLLRNSVGEINFSYIIDEAEKKSQRDHDKNGEEKLANEVVKLLKVEREKLTPNDVSIEKGLMLTRIISYIQENGQKFILLLSDIRMDMRLKLTDNLRNQPISYPNDFRQREHDFDHRRNAQDIRRLFYFTHEELKNPPSLISLQNKVTEHLSYMIGCKMRYESKFRDTGIRECLDIINNSFMIVDQPHCGFNSATVYERRGPGEYGTKASVTIVSLLHDFMETHPNLIEIHPIRPSFLVSSDKYELANPEPMSWKICELQTSPHDKPQRILYAELSDLIIKQSNKNDKHVHFAQKLHSLQFKFDVQINLSEYRFSKIHQISLSSSLFAIANRNCQVPRLLTRVILNDIQRFTKTELPEIRTIIHYMERYFIYRIGVPPCAQTRTYLQEELEKAESERIKYPSLEERFTDFLTSYVHQIDFMAKHPVLSMMYTDRLFLGICNSDRVAEIVNQLSTMTSPVIAFRMNSFKINYSSIAEKSVIGRLIEPDSCAIRNNIYNHGKGTSEQLTLDTAKLSQELSKLVFIDNLVDARNIKVLSNFDDRTNVIENKSFDNFTKYYDPSIHNVSLCKESYKPLDDLFNIANGMSQSTISSGENNSKDSHLTITSTTTSGSVVRTTRAENISTNRISLLDINDNNNTILSQPNAALSQAQKYQIIADYVLSTPELLAEVLHKLNALNLASTTQSQSQHQLELQAQNQSAQSPAYMLFENHQSRSPTLYQNNQNAQSPAHMLFENHQSRSPTLYQNNQNAQSPAYRPFENHQSWSPILCHNNQNQSQIFYPILPAEPQVFSQSFQVQTPVNQQEQTQNIICPDEASIMITPNSSDNEDQSNPTRFGSTNVFNNITRSLSTDVNDLSLDQILSTIDDDFLPERPERLDTPLMTHFQSS
ncbi:unnamed protein product [Adineta steineri]|uniref:Uncharacterized protein n=1 Tax=Adineta steineri TaxID=433720 RepID=A0A814HZS0_9BILA|nr:unnamed protein product [Adineta steineri]CAF3556921.1 unnamed protein product [Adineta steineri]